MGLRNLYRAFHESRSAARKRSSVSITGDSPEAERLAALLGAGRSADGAEVIMAVEADRVRLSGEAVENPGEVVLSATTEEAVLRELAPRVVKSLDEDYLVSLGRGYPIFRRAACKEVSRKIARQNGIIGFLPIPGADMPAITANQGRMVLNIAAIHGEEISLDRARELMGVLAAGFGLRTLARQIVKLVPVGGWAAAGAIGYASTLAMGRAAVLYFERGKKVPEPGELSEIRHWAREEAKSFLKRVRR